jgi:drug/metabolite transporter (DMT)-like permease
MKNTPVPRSGSAVADIGTVLVALTWGTTYVAMQSVGHEVGVGNFLFLRFGGAALLLTLVALPTLRQSSRAEVRLGMEFGVLLFVILALETLGVRDTSAANAGFLIAVSVIFVPLLERATGRPIPRAIWAVTVVALGATAMLALNGGLRIQLGDVIIIAAAAVRAVQIVAFGYRSHAQPTTPCG